jgi:hypothetical protein
MRSGFQSQLLDVGIGAEEDAVYGFELRIAADGFEEFNAGHAREAMVGNHYLRQAIFHLLESQFPRCDVIHFMAMHRQELAYNFSNVRMVIDKKNGGHGRKALRARYLLIGSERPAKANKANAGDPVVRESENRSKAL